MIELLTIASSLEGVRDALNNGPHVLIWLPQLLAAVFTGGLLWMNLKIIKHSEKQMAAMLESIKVANNSNKEARKANLEAQKSNRTQRESLRLTEYNESLSRYRTQLKFWMDFSRTSEHAFVLEDIDKKLKELEQFAIYLGIMPDDAVAELKLMRMINFYHPDREAQSLLNDFNKRLDKFEEDLWNVLHEPPKPFQFLWKKDPESKD